MLDQLPITDLSTLSFSTSKHIRRDHRRLFGNFLHHAMRLFIKAHSTLRARGEEQATQRDHTRLERAIKLLHLTPALLQSTDGRLTRQHRFELFAAGDLGNVLPWLVSYAQQAQSPPKQEDAASKRARAEHIAHQRGGLSKAASLLLSPPSPPRNADTVALLRSKHPAECPEDIAAARRDATARLNRPPPGLSRIPEVEDPFSPNAVSATIRRGNPQSSPGPSGFRFSHLQAALTPDLVETIAQLSRLIFEGHHLPASFWILHSSATLSAIGIKARPVACGDLLRRIIGGTFCKQYGPSISQHFEPLGQYGVAVAGGTELMAARATLAYQQGCSLLTFDARNAFNSMKRRTILPALADIIPPAVPYALNLYARDAPLLLYKTSSGSTEIIRSATGVQQGCNLGPLGYSCGLMPLLRDFRANPPVANAQMMAFIDDITVVLPAPEARNPAAVAAVATWLQTRLEPLGIELNRAKSTILFPAGTETPTWPVADRELLSSTGLKVANEGLRIVGVPVGDPAYVQRTMCDIARGEPATLLRELAALEDAQASLQLLRFSAATRLNSLLRAIPPALSQAAAAEFDTLLEGTLAAIIKGPNQTGETSATGHLRDTPPTAPQSVLTPDAIRQARLPIREGGLGLPSAVAISGPAFIGGQALVLARAMVATNRPSLTQALSDLAATPHAQALCTELRKLTSFASGPQIAEMVGTSWAALALNQDPANRGTGTLLVEAGASGMGPPNPTPQTNGDGHPTQPPPPQGAQSDTPAAPSLGAKPASLPARLHQAQSKITRVLHAAQGLKLLADLKAEAGTVDKQRAFMRFAGARGKGAMAWATCQGVEPWERVAPDLYREILARNMGTHDKDEALGTRCHEGCDAAPSPIHTLTCTRGGMQTHTHQSLLHDFLTRSLRECKIPHEEETTTPFRAGAGPGPGCLRMDVVTQHGALFRDNAAYNSSALLFDVTVTNPLGPTALARAGTRAGSALEEAIKAKKAKYGGTLRPTYKFLPLAFSTCGDQSSSVQDLVKELGRLKAEMDDDYLLATDQGKLGIRARETGRLRRRLSIVMQKALAYRTLRYVARQAIVERGRGKSGPTAQSNSLSTSLTKRARLV